MLNKFKWFTSILLTAALLIGAASVSAAASTPREGWQAYYAASYERHAC